MPRRNLTQPGRDIIGISPSQREITQRERDLIARVLSQPTPTMPPVYHDPSMDTNPWSYASSRPPGWSITLNPTPSFVRSKYGHPSQLEAKEDLLAQLKSGMKSNLRRINTYLEQVAEDRKKIATVESMVVSNESAERPDEPAKPEPASQPVEPTPAVRAVTDWLEARQEYVNEGELDARRTLASEVTSEIP